MRGRARLKAVGSAAVVAGLGGLDVEGDDCGGADERVVVCFE
jgi:hypothetical protein